MLTGDGSVEVLDELLELARGCKAQLRSTVRSLFIDSNPASAHAATGARAPFACLLRQPPRERFAVQGVRRETQKGAER